MSNYDPDFLKLERMPENLAEWGAFLFSLFILMPVVVCLAPILILVWLFKVASGR